MHAGRELVLQAAGQGGQAGRKMVQGLHAYAQKWVQHLEDLNRNG